LLWSNPQQMTVGSACTAASTSRGVQRECCCCNGVTERVSGTGTLEQRRRYLGVKFKAVDEWK
jgi:hypothetical protein